MVSAPAGGLVDTDLQRYHWRPWGCLWSLLTPGTMWMSDGPSTIRGPFYHQRPCCCPWFVLLPRATMLSVVVYADAGNHVDFYDLNCCQKLCGSPWSMMLLIVQDKENSFAMVSVAANSQLRAGDIEGFCAVGYLYTTWGSTIVIGVIKKLNNQYLGRTYRQDFQAENSGKKKDRVTSQIQRGNRRCKMEERKWCITGCKLLWMG